MLKKVYNCLSKGYLLLALLMILYIVWLGKEKLIEGIHVNIRCICLELGLMVLFITLCLKIRKRIFIYVISFFSFALIILLFGLYYYSCIPKLGADAHVVNYIAYNLSTGNLGNCESFYTEYISHYTNNAPLVFQLYRIYKIIKPAELFDTWEICCRIAILFSFAAVYFTYKLIKNTIGERFALASLALIVPMIVLSETSVVLYTDVVALWTVPASLYFLTKADFTDNSLYKIVYVIIASIIIMYGIWNKPQVAVVFLSIIVYWCVQLLSDKYEKAKLKYEICFIAFSIIAIIIMRNMSNSMLYSISSKEYVDNMKIPMEHFVAMGLNPESHGFYNADDVTETMEADGLKNKKELNRNKINDRLMNYGLDGLIKHLQNKFVLTLSSGDFASTGNIYKEELLNSNNTQIMLQGYFLDCGENRFPIIMWIQITYLFLFVIMGIGAVISIVGSENNNSIIDISKVTFITIIGLMLFIALFETNRRYFYIGVPLYIYTAMYYMKIMHEHKHNK